MPQTVVTWLSFFFMSNHKLGENDIYLIALSLINKHLAETVDWATLS